MVCTNLAKLVVLGMSDLETPRTHYLWKYSTAHFKPLVRHCAANVCTLHRSQCHTHSLNCCTHGMTHDTALRCSKKSIAKRLGSCSDEERSRSLWPQPSVTVQYYNVLGCSTIGRTDIVTLRFHAKKEKGPCSHNVTLLCAAWPFLSFIFLKKCFLPFVIDYIFFCLKLFLKSNITGPPATSNYWVALARH